MEPLAILGGWLAADPARRLCFALDFPSWNEAEPVARELTPHVGLVKVGLELFVREGPSLVERARSLAPVFLDLKLHDIPETMERATAAAIATGARLLTVHAAAGAGALERVARRAEATELVPVAVTVLTSLGEEDLRQQGLGAVDEQVERLATIAWGAGIRAFVCSPREVPLLRRKFPTSLLITPGIRAEAGGGGDDQRRTASARRAIAAGADVLVVGRPLRDAVDRRASAVALVEDVRLGLEDRR